MALKVITREYERAWGSKTIDVTEYDSYTEAKKAADEINSKNTSPTAPDYYIQAEIKLD